MQSQGRLERIANSTEDEVALSGYVEEISAVLTDYQVFQRSHLFFHLHIYILGLFARKHYSNNP